MINPWSTLHWNSLKMYVFREWLLRVELFIVTMFYTDISTFYIEKNGIPCGANAKFCLGKEIIFQSSNFFLGFFFFFDKEHCRRIKGVHIQKTHIRHFTGALSSWFSFQDTVSVEKIPLLIDLSTNRCWSTSVIKSIFSLLILRTKASPDEELKNNTPNPTQIPHGFYPCFYTPYPTTSTHHLPGTSYNNHFHFYTVP